MQHTDSLVIAVSFHAKDEGVMIVGRQKNGIMDIVNAFQGEEAEELYKKLTTKIENKGE